MNEYISYEDMINERIRIEKRMMKLLDEKLEKLKVTLQKEINELAKRVENLEEVL